MEFKPLPHHIRYGTDELEQALERKRQAVLTSSYRPGMCVVPWTPEEAPAYDAQRLHNTAIAGSWMEHARRGEIPATIAVALTPKTLHEALTNVRVLPLTRRNREPG